MDKSYVLVERTFEPVTLPVPLVIMVIIDGAIAPVIMNYVGKSIGDEPALVLALPFLVITALLITPWLHNYHWDSWCMGNWKYHWSGRWTCNI